MKYKKSHLLTFFNHRNYGRNMSGKITTWHKGGGHKRLYRKIDFYRNKYNIIGSIISFEYDPNRNCKVACIAYTDGEKRYINYPETSEIGSTILTGISSTVNVQLGITIMINSIPLGSNIYNLENIPNSKAKFARSSGAYACILAKSKSYILIRLPSNQIKTFNKKCFATLGRVNNNFFHYKKLYKAGQSRWLGVKPTVRGVAMNPIDHPHGGGEGKSPVGRVHPCTPWGKPNYGVKTSRNTKL